MPEITASIVGMETKKAVESSQEINQLENGEMFFRGDANTARTPQYYVYLFNVSPITQYVERSWGRLIALGNGVSQRGVVIEAAPEGHEYGKPYIIKDIEQIPYAIVPGLPETAIRGERGEFLAQDVLNPDQPYGNAETTGTMNLANTFNEGTNLYAWGCFRTRNNPPKPEEVVAAKKRWEKKANALLQQGNQLSQQGKAPEITQPMRDAAQYLKVNVPWNQIFRSTIECPGCGEHISPNLARHMPKDKCGWVFNAEVALKKGQLTRKEAKEMGLVLEGEDAT
jgi:hypothetical protein